MKTKKKDLRRKLKRFFAKIRWRIRSFSSDHPVLKSRWGDAKSRWGDASPLQFKCWAYPKQKFWVRQWIGDRLKKNFKELFFLENTCACVLGPWPWPRAFLSLVSMGSVLGNAVLGLGLGFFLCPWPRALCPRLHRWYSIYIRTSGTAVVSLGGAARPGCHHFGVTPYYEVKPYLHWFMVKILFSILIWTENQHKKLHSGLLVKKIWFHHFGFIIESSFWFREKNEYNNF